MGWERVEACGCRYVRRSDKGAEERWERVLTCTECARLVLARKCALAEARLVLARKSG